MTAPALQSLLTGLIDYAGLFPPAGLEMAAAIHNYDSYERGEYAWMLGRFIVPAARLEEYAEAVRNVGIDASAWSLSLLATAADAEVVAGFNRGADESGGGGLGSIDALEIKAASAREIQDAAQALGGNYQLYFEAPPEKWQSLLQATAVAKARAKIRTGGEVATAIPEESQVLEFLRIASERRLAFKATAGLHHPLRAMQRLTYKPDSPTGVMHGFLNVFCAAALLWHEPERRQEAAWMLAERDADAITMDEMSMTWHNSGVTLTAEQIRAAREQFSIGFGSCSFTEPIEDLRKLGWL
jgi:signal recognition particle subunit SEC65